MMFFHRGHSEDVKILMHFRSVFSYLKKLFKRVPEFGKGGTIYKTYTMFDIYEVYNLRPVCDPLAHMVHKQMSMSVYETRKF